MPGISLKLPTIPFAYMNFGLSETVPVLFVPTAPEMQINILVDNL